MKRKLRKEFIALYKKFYQDDTIKYVGKNEFKILNTFGTQAWNMATNEGIIGVEELSGLMIECQAYSCEEFDTCETCQGMVTFLKENILGGNLK